MDQSSRSISQLLQMLASNTAPPPSDGLRSPLDDELDSGVFSNASTLLNDSIGQPMGESGGYLNGRAPLPNMGLDFLMRCAQQSPPSANNSPLDQGIQTMAQACQMVSGGELFYRRFSLPDSQLTRRPLCHPVTRWVPSSIEFHEFMSLHESALTQPLRFIHYSPLLLSLSTLPLRVVLSHEHATSLKLTCDSLIPPLYIQHC